MLIPSLFLTILLLSSLLLRFHIRLRKEIEGMARTTKDIRSGQLNRRYRLYTRHNHLQDLGGELNRMVDSFQAALERIRTLEDERKRMISNLSHDLRTPLTSLLGYMEALRTDPSLTEEERAAFLRIAADKGQALMTLLEQFFELARLESDGSAPELEEINLTDLLPEVVLGFYPDFTRAEITPSLDLPDKPVYARGDAAYVRRILNNLLSNALRYGTDGREIGLSLREEAGLAWVEVWDRGQGIPPQELSRVFDRLYTGEASRNRNIRGTGLGLTIVKHLVEQQDGRIEVSSLPGERTVFSVGLPSLSVSRKM
ncbi:HAMP domain-containing histidine kinase [Paenibacillus sp. CC-CFT747]|nr:HAMP domain-containing histidine kinase [Paenibacillus sp. CC-CFT747]